MRGHIVLGIIALCTLQLSNAETVNRVVCNTSVDGDIYGFSATTLNSSVEGEVVNFDEFKDRVSGYIVHIFSEHCEYIMCCFNIFIYKKRERSHYKLWPIYHCQKLRCPQYNFILYACIAVKHRL